MINLNIDPVAFTIGSLEIRWYGIFIALGIVVGVLWMLRALRGQNKVSYDTALTAAIIGIPSGLIFSRLLHVLDYWQYYSQYPSQIIGTAGLTIYGGILGGALGIWVYSRISKAQFGYFADLAIPGVVLAQSIGRLGCTANGCCYGLETTLPWGFAYTQSASLAPLGIATHPTVVYEIFFLLLLFGALFKLKGKLTPDGSLFLVYLGMYGLWRFVSDFLREGEPFLFGLHQAQVIGLIIMALSVSMLAYRTRWAKKVEEPSPELESQP